MPVWLKIVLSGIAIFMVMNKRSSDAMLNNLNKYKRIIVAVRPQIMEALSEIYREHEERKGRAAGLLEEVMALLSDFDKADGEIRG